MSRPSAPTSAAAERGSSGHGAIRWLTSAPDDDDVAAVEQASSCSAEPERTATFVPTSGKSSTSSFAASRGLTTTGSGS